MRPNQCTGGQSRRLWVRIGLASLVLATSASALAGGRDVVLCYGEVPTEAYTDGDDVIIGTEGDDVLFGGDGDDTIFGNGGNDLICGHKGHDTLIGGPGDDSINGHRGADTISYADAASGVTINLTTGIATGEGSDSIKRVEHITGSEFDDTITGNGGKNKVSGLGGNDTISGLGKRDLLSGGHGNDWLIGGEGGDALAGNGGDDVLYGQGHNDKLKGASGNDKLLGGEGTKDDLDGGNGTDQCANGERGPGCEEAVACDPAYPDSGVCLPTPLPDLDCGDITHRGFTALQPDPHGFDDDMSGFGCDSPHPYLYDITFFEDGITPSVVYHSALIPYQANVSPDDDVLVTNKFTREIHRLLPSLDTEVYLSIDPAYGEYVQHFDFGPDGALWFSSTTGMYREQPDGSFLKVSHKAKQTFKVGPDGNAYTAGEDIMRITPGGTTTEIALIQSTGRAIAIADDGTLYIVDGLPAELVSIDPDDGTIETLLGGLSWDFSPVITPDGTMYLIEQRGLFLPDLEAGTKSEIEWMTPYRNTASAAVSDSSGILYLFGNQRGVYRVDLTAETVEVVAVVRANSHAMSVSPDGRAFVTFGATIPGSEIELHMVLPSGELSLVSTFPYRHAGGVAFGSDGTGYISVGWPSTGVEEGQPGYEASQIITFDPDTGVTGVVHNDPNEMPGDISVDPTTGELWWSGAGGFHHLDGAGVVHAIPYPDASAQRGELEFLPDGTIIARVDWPHEENGLVNWAIYERPPAGDWLEVYDGRASSENVFEFAACPNGDIYLVNESFSDTMHGILRIEGGALVHVATDAGVDPFVAHCHPTTGDLYYTHALGIIHWTFEG